MARLVTDGRLEPDAHWRSRFVREMRIIGIPRNAPDPYFLHQVRDSNRSRITDLTARGPNYGEILDIGPAVSRLEVPVRLTASMTAPQQRLE